jgi:hypothetical protein
VRYLLNETLLRLIKPLAALLLGLLLYWIATGVLGEPGSVLLGLACWISAAALILLLETGVI